MTETTILLASYSDDEAFVMAELQGSDDARQGIKQAQCPYPLGSMERDGWLSGWRIEHA